MANYSGETNRREFLSGKSAVHALESALPRTAPHPSGEPGEADARSQPATYVVHVGRTAMASEFEILLNAGQHPGATEAAVAALDMVDELETQLTVFRASSEVVSINRRAAVDPVPVETRLFALLQLAVELHVATQGAFDITSGPLSKVWGFFRREGQFPSAEAIALAKSRVGSEWLELDADHETVRFGRPDLEFNLNAIGKGYALDRCAELLASRGIQDFLIHGGQSSILARGSRTDGESPGSGWRVSVKHPFRPHERLGELSLCDRALGTSGSGNQFFHFQGKRYGHVIDPRSGWPADRVLSTTVLAPDAATADALATALFVMGLEESLPFCHAHPELAAILVSPGQRAGDIELHTIGLQPHEWRENR